MDCQSGQSAKLDWELFENCGVTVSSRRRVE